LSTLELVTVTSLCWSVTISSYLAWDFGRRWLQERAALRASNDTLVAVLKRQDENELVLKKLAEDWMKKFVQLEADWKKLKEHADSQFAGVIAQVHPGQTRGFGR
jgi:hypothetical protein